MAVKVNRKKLAKPIMAKEICKNIEEACSTLFSERTPSVDANRDQIINPMASGQVNRATLGVSNGRDVTKVRNIIEKAMNWKINGELKSVSLKAFTITNMP